MFYSWQTDTPTREGRNFIEKALKNAIKKLASDTEVEEAVREELEMDKERELECEVTFPHPTHWVDLPPGYEGSRAVALKLLNGSRLFDQAFDYVPPPEAKPSLPPAVTTGDAIGDLPIIDARTLLRDGKLRRGARRLDEPLPYDDQREVSDSHG